ncbi:Pre-mRNA-splicing factor slt11 [Erysiphe necator]|uniref:Putative pre-mrna-splicing factor slt11 n=1 Tax=Uncinula necator TaxID=52586 RepID=A0A0B1P9T6_UNCNE|nr:Pre-mRNA-splicing factor slt11 [Erysiphe necator]KHJ35447.1 putative pre-mrna-splicing factor slt11 [Erysiphe necator]
MPPQIKQDLNRSGWETTDFPSVCENCLPETRFVQMLKEDHGAECKICTRPYTIFQWKSDRTSRSKHTNICLTCARLKNCCQCCMLDLAFALPIVVRDAALRMVAPGPQSAVNREYYAQEHEREIEDGRGGTEAYEKTDEKARELLRRLANSEPYYKKQRRIEAPGEEGMKSSYSSKLNNQSTGPIRTRDSRADSRLLRNSRLGSRPFPSTAQLRPTQADILPPRDPNITSLFITGIEDDLPEHMIRAFFAPLGSIRSLVCSHLSHCAFINFQTRKDAEVAAKHCQGRAVIAGVPLRVRWGKPKPIGMMEKHERIAIAGEGRAAFSSPDSYTNEVAGHGNNSFSLAGEDLTNIEVTVPPPGSENVQYASLVGN